MLYKRMNLESDWDKHTLGNIAENGDLSSSDVGSTQLQLHLPTGHRTGGFNLIEDHFDVRNETNGNVTSAQSQSISYRGTLLIVVAVLSIFCNVFILLVILFNRKLRGSIANVLLCHLGILGFTYTILLLPSYTSLTFSQKWYQYEALCVFQGYMCSVLSTATLLTLTAISLDKYKTIASPLHYSTSVNRRKMTLCLIFIWVISFLLCSLPAVIGPGYTYSNSKACCDVDYAHTLGGVPRWVTLPVLLIAFYIPGGVLLFCYCRIFRIARGHSKRITAMLAMVAISFQAPITRGSTSSPQPKEQKASRTIGFFLGSFFLCYIPYTVISIIQVIFLLPINFYVMVTIAILFHSAPVINAIVYGSMNKALRCCLLYSIRKFIYSRPAVNQYNNMKEGGNTPILSRSLSVKSNKIRQVKSSPFLSKLTVNNGLRITCSTPALNTDECGENDRILIPKLANSTNSEKVVAIRGAHSFTALPISEDNHITSV